MASSPVFGYLTTDREVAYDILEAQPSKKKKNYLDNLVCHYETYEAYVLYSFSRQIWS